MLSFGRISAEALSSSTQALVPARALYIIWMTHLCCCCCYFSEDKSKHLWTVGASSIVICVSVWTALSERDYRYELASARSTRVLS
jgi:hypothetical protein